MYDLAVAVNTLIGHNRTQNIQYILHPQMGLHMKQTCAIVPMKYKT